MTAVTRDAYGLAVSTSSRPAVDAYDRGVRALLGFGADTVERFREAVAADPEFVLARAALAVALYLDEQVPAARAEMERAASDGAARAASLTARERRCGIASWAASVRVWQLMSRGRDPSQGRPPPEGVHVAYAPAPTLGLGAACPFLGLGAAPSTRYPRTRAIATAHAPRPEE